jgi:hypothetical protein
MEKLDSANIGPMQFGRKLRETNAYPHLTQAAAIWPVIETLADDLNSAAN